MSFDITSLSTFMPTKRHNFSHKFPVVYVEDNIRIKILNFFFKERAVYSYLSLSLLTTRRLTFTYLLSFVRMKRQVNVA